MPSERDDAEQELNDLIEGTLPEDAQPSLNIQSGRVRVFQHINSAWVHRGIGFCFGTFSEVTHDGCLIVRSEEDYSLNLLFTIVREEVVYERPSERKIGWMEPGRTFALSFEHVEGCEVVWSWIGEVQQFLKTMEGHSD